MLKIDSFTYVNFVSFMVELYHYVNKISSILSKNFFFFYSSSYYYLHLYFYFIFVYFISMESLLLGLDYFHGFLTALGQKRGRPGFHVMLNDSKRTTP